jgi:hypothetical protein
MNCEQEQQCATNEDDGTVRRSQRYPWVLSLAFMGASFLCLFQVDAHSQDLASNVVD